MRMIIGISSASGTVLAEALLRGLRAHTSVETHLVVSGNALRTLELETRTPPAELFALAHQVHASDDISASIASGTFLTAGMVVIPCSMKTLAGIVSGYSDNLLLRAADVTLKERRKLVLVTREMPLSTLHLENMLKASQYGAVILPPMLTFYHQPQTIADLIDHVVGKVFSQFGLEYPPYRTWQGAPDHEPG
jgi:4-hydroxy-3-polyprenylbenzoate decarboxylase